MRTKATTDARDSAQLEALGYDSKFDRSMSLWSNFALGFTYLSPVVGVYTVFAFAIATGGPPMFWSYLFVGLGQLLVALVFGEIVSQFPIAGGLYPWARRLVGKRWAWMAGWVYLWALCTTIAAVAVGGAPYVAQLLGINVSQGGEVAIAVAMIVATTALNVSGTKLLAPGAPFWVILQFAWAGVAWGGPLSVRGFFGITGSKGGEAALGATWVGAPTPLTFGGKSFGAGVAVWGSFGDLRGGAGGGCSRLLGENPKQGAPSQKLC